MGNNGKFVGFADVHHFYFSHTANCLEGEYKTSSPSSKLADNSDLSHPAIGNNIVAFWSCTERESTYKTAKDYFSTQQALLTEISNC